MDAVEEAGGRVESGGIKGGLDRLCGLGCHLQVGPLCRRLVLTEVLAGALEALGSFLQSASARGDVVFGELLQQLHVNGILIVCSCSWVCVWDLSYFVVMFGWCWWRIIVCLLWDAR